MSKLKDSGLSADQFVGQPIKPDFLKDKSLKFSEK